MGKIRHIEERTLPVSWLYVWGIQTNRLKLEMASVENEKCALENKNGILCLGSFLGHLVAYNVENEILKIWTYHRFQCSRRPANTKYQKQALLP